MLKFCVVFVLIAGSGLASGDVAGDVAGDFSKDVARPQNSATFDSPDLALEKELHRQFLNRGLDSSRDTPAPVQTLAPDAYVESHKIQAGESLWSLSRLLYGDGNYWPRVWAENKSITNPHLIRPGHELQFLMGSEDDTPAFRISEEGEDGAQLASAGAGSQAIEIPPPEIAPRPVLKVPASFPEWQNVYKRQPKPIIDDRGLAKKRDPIADRIYLRAWVEEHDLDPAGFFLENDTESGLPVVNQYVFIKMKRGVGRVGQKLLIAHSAGEIRTVQDDFDNRIPAFLMQAAGELEITEPIHAEFSSSRDRENFEGFRALMTKTTGLSQHGNVLIVGELPYVNLDANGAHGSVESEIVGSERHVTSMLFGQGDIVFLNRGSNSGIAVGQIFDIYGNRRARYPGTPVRFSPAASGRLKVVKTSGSLSTALILSAHDSVMQGDSVRAISGRHDEVERMAPPHMAPIWGGMITDSEPSPTLGSDN